MLKLVWLEPGPLTSPTSTGDYHSLGENKVSCVGREKRGGLGMVSCGIHPTALDAIASDQHRRSLTWRRTRAAH